MSFGGEQVSSFSHTAGLNNDGFATSTDSAHVSKQTAIDLFTRFILEFEVASRQRIYRDQLQINFNQKDYFLEVDLMDLASWSLENSPNFDMRSNLLEIPLTIVPIFEFAATKAMKFILDDTHSQNVPNFQVTLKNYEAVIPLSQLQGNLINKVVVIQGIIVSAFKPQLKAVKLKLRCRGCGNAVAETAESMSAYSTIPIPNRCYARNDNNQVAEGAPPCPTAPYEIVGDECQYIDVQELKLQEAPEQVPSGEMPRQVKLSCNRVLVDKVKPGTRVTAIGIYTTTTSKGSRKNRQDGGKAVEYSIPYVSILGLTTDSSASQIVEGLISDEEQAELRELVNNSRDIYDRIARSIAPAIMGKEDVKKALACSLFGGTQKKLPDGMTLRGDINVLLLGDPSVAKSQFLKFASQVAPISVYTSGKGSSAAGLTASVVRSQTTGDFHLEAGALVLADGGMVCIDEFDKMREQDRVAIHEAMEQQTISIAKAGITTVLNSRCSVLAAANPVFGRYDDMKSATENIDFQATILSRFDLIFILRDIQEDALDESLASHLINVHKFGDRSTTSTSAGMIDNFANGVSNETGQAQQQQQQQQEEVDRDDLIPPDTLKKLIAFSRRIRPRLSESAKLKIIDEYVNSREQLAETKRQNPGAQVIPITVRQLEAMIRLSESIARMSLAEEATEHHVREAIRLFHVATLQASASASQLGPGATVQGAIDIGQIQQRCENFVLGRLNPGQSMATRALMNELIAQDFPEGVILRSFQVLVTRGALGYQRQQKEIFRPNV